MEQQEIDSKIETLKTESEFINRRISQYQFRWWIAVSWLVGGGLLGYAISRLTKNESTEHIIAYAIISAVIAIFIYSYYSFVVRNRASFALRRIEIRMAELGGIELKETIEENFFTKLVKINFKYLDQYYLQTQEQAEKRFRLSSFASISGFILIIVGILMLYFKESNQEASNLAGYITTASGLLIEFIAAVFFYLYNQTVLKMSEYHQKLVLTQNISLALKITDDMDEPNKSKSLEMLIDRLTTDVNKYLTELKKSLPPTKHRIY